MCRLDADPLRCAGPALTSTELLRVRQYSAVGGAGSMVTTSVGPLVVRVRIRRGHPAYQMGGVGRKLVEALVCWRTMIGTSKRYSEDGLEFRLAMEGKSRWD